MKYKRCHVCSFIINDEIDRCHTDSLQRLECRMNKAAVMIVLCSLQWRHDGHDGVSNHQPHECLLNRLFRHRSKKTSKLRVIGLCEGNSPVTGEFPAQRASNVENVSIWWRHHYPRLSVVELIWWKSTQNSVLSSHVLTRLMNIPGVPCQNAWWCPGAHVISMD